MSIRQATPDDAAGVAAVLNGVIAGGRHSLLDTPFTVAEERAYIEALPERSFLHVAETAGSGVIGFQTVIPWNTFTTHEFDHVATMGTYVDERQRRSGVGAALAAASFAAARALGYEKVFTDLRADNLDSLGYHLGLGFNDRRRRAPARARRRARHRRHLHRALPEGVSGMLYVCATPIGNLGDVTPRVLEALRAAELIAAEDTRHTRKLLSHFDIHVADDQPLPAQRGAEDGGGAAPSCATARTWPWSPTPACPACRIPACAWWCAPLPRASTSRCCRGRRRCSTALVAAGIDGDGFRFVGYLPRRARELETVLHGWRRCGGLVVAFETGQRLARSIAVLAACLPEARAAVCRELTKVHEEVVRGTLLELSERYAVPGPDAGPRGAVRGEITLVLDLGPPLDEAAAARPQARAAAARPARPRPVATRRRRGPARVPRAARREAERLVREVAAEG